MTMAEEFLNPNALPTSQVLDTSPIGTSPTSTKNSTSLSEVLGVIPNRLQFALQLNTQAGTTITLQSRIDHPLAFKIKTTRPKRYCVQPNVARLAAGDSVRIEVTMREIEGEFPKDLDRCKDKFQILAVVLDEELEDTNLDEIWLNAPEDKIKQQKLKVVLKKATEDEMMRVLERKLGSAPLPEGFGGGMLLSPEMRRTGSEPVDGQNSAGRERRNMAGNYYPLGKPKPVTLSPLSSLMKDLNGGDKVMVSGAKPPLPSPRSLRRRENLEVMELEGERERVLEQNKKDEEDRLRLERERLERERMEEEERQRVQREREEKERRRREEERERVEHPAVAPVPAAIKLSPQERKRVAGEKAEVLVRCLKEREARIEELRKKLAEETGRLADARMAVAGAQHVKYEVDHAAKIPVAQVGLMAVIAITALTMLV